MKKYLNPLFLAPVLGFILPFFLNIGEIRYYSSILYFLIGFLCIFFLNLWNYFFNKKILTAYNFLMTIFVVGLSSTFSNVLSSGWGTDGIGFISLLVSYAFILFCLTISNLITTFSQQEIKVDSIKEEQAEVKVEKKLIILRSYSWTFIPFLFIILLPLINIIYTNSSGFDIIFYMFYLFIFQINRNFLNSKSIYKIVMLIILIFDTSLYLYITMLGLDNDAWYLVFFPMILILSVILLLIIGRIDKKNQNKLISQT